MAEIAVEMYNISKQYRRVLGNDHVNIKVQRGEVHAIIGENGAGKTTLMNILYGLIQPTDGEIFIRGKQVNMKSPRVAIEQGIGMVHQHFMLIPQLTVWENIILGREPTSFILRVTNQEKAEQGIDSLSRQFGFNIQLNALVGSLPVGTAQRVEIIKLLYRGAEIIILDEPTSFLTPQETEELFVIIRRLKENGKTIIFISHKLKEVMAISDRITLMRGGENLGTFSTVETNIEELAFLMVGKKFVAQIKEERIVPRSQVILKVNQVSVTANGRRMLRDVTFQICAGEILGVAGVAGNGQTELVEVLTGLRKTSSGTIILNSQDITNLPPRPIREQGLAHIPEDRIKRGLVLDYTVEENLILGAHYYPPFRNRWRLNYSAIKQEVDRLIDNFNIRTPSRDFPARSLSGGNQQKMILARELSRGPVCLIADQPTRGLDIASTEFTHQYLLDARNKGMAILLVSMELEEILSLSDRIAVMYDGEITGFVNPKEVNEKELGLLMTGVTKRG